MRRMNTTCAIFSLLTLAACTTQAPTVSKAKFDSPLFARPPQVMRKGGQYLLAIFPKEGSEVIVAAVATEQSGGRTLVYASKLARGRPAGMQVFALDIPPSVEPALLKQALYWRDPNDWAEPLDAVDK